MAFRLEPLMIILAHLVLLTHELTRRTSMGSEESYVSTTLVFEITSKPGMSCFHEHFRLGSSLQVTLSTFNTQSQPISMRITSPNQVFSEWFEGVDLITYEGNVVESGEHEICVSARVPMGNVKVELDIISYDTQLVQAFLDEMLKTRKTEAAVMSVVERITERVQKMFGSVRYNSFMVRRDTNLQRKNLHYIDVFSTLQTVFMLVSGVAQVIIIRKLFFVDAKKIRI